MSDRSKNTGAGRGLRTALVVLLTLIVLVVAALVVYAMRNPSEAPAVGQAEIVQSRPTEPAPTGTTEPSGTTQPEATTTTEEETSEPTVSAEERKAQAMLDDMTLEEKIYQLFIVTPRTLTGFTGVDTAGETTRQALARYPVGGIVYFGENINSAGQISAMISATQDYASCPLFICVDEEGGRVSRLSGIGVTDTLDPMAVYGAQGDAGAVRSIGRTLAGQLASVGFNVDFAPVADVVTNPNNTEIGDRAFSDDPAVAAKLVAAMVRGLQESGTISCLKHFPGHGSTEADSHEGLSVSNRTLDELRETEFLPFAAGIGAGAEMVMISHMSAPELTGDNTPCDLSAAVVTDLLRGELGFTGVIVTDSHEMGAITQYYGTGEAAVMAIEAGCDIVLMPYDLDEAYAAVAEAVENGTLTEERIDESVLRILTLKYRYGIIE